MRPTLVVLALLALDRTAAAEPRLGYQLELAQSLAVPIGDRDATRLTDPAYGGSLRFALLVALPHGLHIGPFVSLGGVAVNTDDATFEDRGLDARYGRLRLALGPHLAYRVTERVDVWLRVGLGFDYASGSVHTKLGAFRVTDGSSTTFAIDPQVGATVRVWRMLTVGGSVGFPVAVAHGFAGTADFTVADLELSLLVGARL